MLDKQKLLELNSKGEYNKISQIFTEEYREIIKDFLFKKTCIKYENSTLSELLMILETIDDGKYVEVSNTLEEMYLDEENTNVKLLTSQIDEFKNINKILNN